MTKQHFIGFLLRLCAAGKHDLYPFVSKRVAY